MMKELADVPTCEYSNDLISFVYSELSDKESQEFKLHLNTCNQCSAELDSFGEMRDAIGAWKYQSLAGVSAAEETHEFRAAKKKSARAALREFFDWSPLWMKGAIGLATILFCVLAVIATGKLNDKSGPVPAVTSEKTYTQQEVNELVAKARAEASSSTGAAVVKNNLPPNKGATNNVERHQPVVPQVARSKRPLSKAERQQLAVDLRLTSSDDDTVNLITDRINE